jgi:hypothetical protein
LQPQRQQRKYKNNLGWNSTQYGSVKIAFTVHGEAIRMDIKKPILKLDRTYALRTEKPGFFVKAIG